MDEDMDGYVVAAYGTYTLSNVAPSDGVSFLIGMDSDLTFLTAETTLTSVNFHAEAYHGTVVYNPVTDYFAILSYVVNNIDYDADAQKRLVLSFISYDTAYNRFFHINSVSLSPTGYYA